MFFYNEKSASQKDSSLSPLNFLSFSQTFKSIIEDFIKKSSKKRKFITFFLVKLTDENNFAITFYVFERL
ncbi:hypothetical protein AVL50_14270 [Flammeovirga sp. SJP92]|nr:hypothetical protein AVL50_14270 [Flammeovirga sp. SJP92]